MASGKHFDRLLLTGAAGNLGTVLRPRLAALAEVLRVSDIRDCGAAAAAEEVVGCDLADAGAVDALVAGVDAIVHLGGIATESSFQKIVRTNIEGTFNVYEAARRHGPADRLRQFQPRDRLLSPVRGDRRRGAVAPRQQLRSVQGVGENLARFYFDRYGIESVCLRIGSSFPEPADRRMLTTWLSFDDLFELVRTSLLTPAVGFTVVFGASANRDSWWNNRLAAHLGFAPKDNTERFRARIEAEQPLDPGDPAAVYHGGAYTAMGPFDEAFEASFDHRGKPR